MVRITLLPHSFCRENCTGICSTNIFIELWTFNSFQTLFRLNIDNIIIPRLYQQLLYRPIVFAITSSVALLRWMRVVGVSLRCQEKHLNADFYGKQYIALISNARPPAIWKGTRTQCSCVFALENVLRNYRTFLWVAQLSSGDTRIKCSATNGLVHLRVRKIPTTKHPASRIIPQISFALVLALWH